MPMVDVHDEAAMTRYTEFVRNSPYAQACQDPAWSQVKNNWQPFYFFLEEDGAICAAMSVLTITAAKGKKLAYANRGPICDPRDVQLVKKMFDEAESYLQEVQDIFLLRCDPEVLYDPQLQEAYEAAGFLVRNSEKAPHATIQPRMNMRLDTAGKSEDELLASFHSKTRYNIRLAARKGVEVSWSRSDEAVKAFYDTHEVMSKRQGITHRPLEYFQRVMAAFGENARIYLATYEGEVLSGALCLSYGTCTWYMYGGSTNSHRNLMPNYLMQWEMIKWGLERGTRWYDFGGIFEIDETDGLYKFKRGFVGEDNVTAYIGELDRVYDEAAYQEYLHK